MKRTILSGLLGLAAVSSLAACQSAGQFEQRPPTWTSLYQAHWESMANCIVARSQQPLLTVTPTFSAGRANIIVKNAAGGVMGTFDVRSVNNGRDTQVDYRSVYGGPDTDAGGGAQNIANRCARP
jgi:hypothetical protein